MKHIPRTTFLFALISTLPMSLVAAPEKQAELTEKNLLQSFDSMADTLKQARQQVSQAVAERDKALDHLKASHTAQAERDHQIAELKKQLAASQKQGEAWKQQLAESQKQGASLKQQLVESQKQGATLKQQLAESQKHTDAWKQQAVAYEKSAAEWKKTADERAARLAIGGEVQKRLGGFRERLDKTMLEFGTLETELAKLRDELKEPRQMAALVKENEQLKIAVSKTRNELKSVAASNGAMQKDLAASRKSIDAIGKRAAETQRAAEADRTKLQAALEKAQGEVAQTRKQMEQVAKAGESRTRELEQQHQAALKSLAAARQELETARKQADERQKQLAEARRELAGASDSHKKLTGEIERREQTIQDLRGKLESRKEETAGTNP